MYIPAHFEESRTEILHALVRAHPFASLITQSSPDGINANHIPLCLSHEHGQFGVLRGHVARSNPMWGELALNAEAMAIFQGPDSYITPSWYPTKQKHGKVVPTWNYAVVHAHGLLTVIDDSSWLRSHLETLVIQQEALFSEPWSVSDAPKEFTDKLIGEIVGIEMVITRLKGKWKISQNQPAQNQAGVVCGLKKSGGRNAVEMAGMIEAVLRHAHHKTTETD